VQSYLK